LIDVARKEEFWQRLGMDTLAVHIKHDSPGQNKVLVRSHKIMTMSPRLGTIEQGGVVVALNREAPPLIEAVGRAADFERNRDLPVIDCRDALLIPGLINCHTHLELSALAGRTRSHQGFTAWASSLHPLMQEDVKVTAIARGLRRMVETGTVAAADMGGYHASRVAEALENDSRIELFFMIQRMGFSQPKNDTLRPYAFARDLALRYLPARRFAYAGHALFSTHPRTLQLTKAWCDEHGLPFAIHLAESRDEVDLLRDGTGPLAAVLGGSGLLPSWFTPPGITPVAHAHELGLLGPNTLAIHCVQATDQDIELLAATETSVCLCPCSNAYIGVGTAPVTAMVQAGVNLCLGTDGLSSNDDLDLGREMDALLAMNSDLPLETVVAMGTRNGARILGIMDAYGTIEPGQRASLAMIEYPPVEPAIRRKQSD
jgi:cytosine/adenosine deaminase-related metal-dependent hydrolase